MEVQGRTILITGASSGIGAATARAVARSGGHAVGVARTKAKLDELVAEIEAAGGRATAYELDCSDREAVAQMTERIEREVGTPDVLVNNAGAGRFLFFEETPPEEFERMMSAPFYSTVYMTRALLPGMLARGSGLIVNINTPVAFVAWPAAAGYASARWALRGLNDSLSADLDGTGVKVTQVVPGKVASTYFEHNPGAADGIPGMARLVPTLTPQDVADAIVGAIRSEKRLVFTPFMLRVMMLQARMFPRLVRRIAIRTSRPRPGATSR
jgi:uncharacterized protein